MFLHRKTAPVLDASVEPWDSDITDRFASVTVTDSHLVGFGYDGKVVSLPVARCVGEVYDWDAGIVIECPDHRGVFCPGERSLAS